MSFVPAKALVSLLLYSKNRFRVSLLLIVVLCTYISNISTTNKRSLSFVVCSFQIQVVVPYHPWRLQQRRLMSSNTNEDDSTGSNNEEFQMTLLNNNKKKQPRLSPTGFSYVEEGVYASAVEEIEAMGGDPSFLSIMDNNTSVDNDVVQMNETATATATAVEKWEWDGVEENDAYFDE